ncbi:hypothetical protein [Flavobacterium okayamense]|uniref:Uncharacterized protein n=1 Tax=Flavobacterium okayamense TaxID=2830782 RepID=A0ABN6HVY2_9FLAO|nr:hypothetical protein [Flavobacterium okayamense]BCY27595.1 hypothetical protein KK2020170_04630 [Flavobacterium okayamense]
MVKIIDKVKLLEVNEDDLLNEIINESFIGLKKLLKAEISKIDSNGIIIIEGTPENYDFKIKSEDESSIFTIETIINRLID